jgi:mxaK protein
MASRINIINSILVIFLLIGIVGTAQQSYQCISKKRINNILQLGQVLKDDDYPLLSKFSAAYFQGSKNDYGHAVQTYGQILELQLKSKNPNAELQAKIQYNIATNLFLSGLGRDLNEDGSLKDESKYSFTQARVAYEQSLKLNPDDRLAKFNLSLLNSVLPINMISGLKDQSGQELSNLPIGLP